MSTFWQRHRRKAAALLATGAAGAAAAYYAYKWYYDDAGEGDEDAVLELDLDGPSTSASARLAGSRAVPASGVLVDPRGGPGGPQLDADAHLQHHFDSIQDIANATTIPSLLPALSAAMAAADDVSQLKERLRRARAGAETLDPGEKVALWEDLACGALARLALACWALPLLGLQVRVQLNVLGRHLYLETALAEAAGGASEVRRLSAASQEKFLAFAEHLAKGGLAALLLVARRAARASLLGVSMNQEMDAAALEAVLSDALAAFAGEAAAGGWAARLLPSPAALREALEVRAPDNRAVLPAAEGVLVDVAAVEGMVGEVGRILSSERLHEVATVSAKSVAAAAARHLAQRLHGEAMPLAKAVPLILSEAEDVLSPRGECSALLASMSEVRALCATVYSCGPPL